MQIVFSTIVHSSTVYSCTHIVYSAMQYIYSLQCNAVDINSAMCVRPFTAAYAQCRCGLGSHDSMEWWSTCLMISTLMIMNSKMKVFLLSFSSNNILSPLVSHSCAGHTLKGCQEEVAVTKFGCPIKVVRFKAMQSLP